MKTSCTVSACFPIRGMKASNIARAWPAVIETDDRDGITLTLTITRPTTGDEIVRVVIPEGLLRTFLLARVDAALATPQKARKK